MKRLKTIFALIAALQFTTMSVAPKSEALILGITTGGGVFFILGSLFTLTGGLALKDAKQQSDFIPAYYTLGLGLVLDEPTPPIMLDRTQEMPPSLSEVYVPETATHIWSQIKEIDQGLENEVIQIEFPQAIKTHLTSKEHCNSVCKKNLRAAETVFLNEVKTRLEAIVNQEKPEGRHIALSEKTTKFIIETFGYTFTN